MRIGGLQRFSLIDYPGKLAAVVFTQGCNFRCCYCHNPELVLPEQFRKVIPEEEVLEFLARRGMYINGVVVTGGEPTQHGDLAAFLEKVKRMGYLIKLDTNGSRPRVLQKLIQLKLVNYIAMDVKAPLHGYQKVIGVDFPVARIKESIDIIIRSGLEHEFRTTVVKSCCSKEDLNDIMLLINGAQKYSVQMFVAGAKMIDQGLSNESHYSEEEFHEIKNSCDETFKSGRFLSGQIKTKSGG